jgi:hypothetical protein
VTGENDREPGSRIPAERYDIPDVVRGELSDEATFEIRLVNGSEGRQLARAQARALRDVLRWAADTQHGRAA